MIKPGDWVECDNGYGVAVLIFPEYYEYDDDSIPEDKKVGDFRQNVVVVKRFCSFDFKVYPQTRIVSDTFATPIPSREMAKIKKLLKDEAIARRFEKYEAKSDVSEVKNIDLWFSDKEVALLRQGIEQLSNNGNLSMTLREVELWMKEQLNLELFAQNKRMPKFYLQLIGVGLGVYRGKESLYKELKVRKGAC